MVGSINSCNNVKDVKCFNKSKTKGSSDLINLKKTFLSLKTNFKGLLSITHGCGINLRFNEMARNKYCQTIERVFLNQKGGAI